MGKDFYQKSDNNLLTAIFAVRLIFRRCAAFEIIIFSYKKFIGSDVIKFNSRFIFTLPCIWIWVDVDFSEGKFCRYFDYLTVDKSNSVVPDDGDYFEHDNLEFR